MQLAGNEAWDRYLSPVPLHKAYRPMPLNHYAEFIRNLLNSQFFQTFYDILRNGHYCFVKPLSAIQLPPLPAFILSMLFFR